MTRFGFVSTYPPTLCGLATFTSALRAELCSDGPTTVIRALESGRSAVPAIEVAADLIANDPGSVRHVVGLLARCDAVIVQHEYGIYGGPDGEQVLDLLRALKVPSIVVLHTVLTSPSQHQREILESITDLADAVITMTHAANTRLAAGYAVDMTKVSVIPHGAPAIPPGSGPLFRSGEPTVLTWGLLGPGKGIEWGIEAMAQLADLNPAVNYVVAGLTHPKVLAREGEAYRTRLQELVRAFGLAARVRFEGHYRDQRALTELVASADLVLLPYDSTDQVTSGVLIEAVAALKPVVATRFPHAVELLADGAGLLVPHRDPNAIAAALRTLITHRELAAGMNRKAIASAPDLLWPAVAQRYRVLAERIVRDRIAA